MICEMFRHKNLALAEKYPVWVTPVSIRLRPRRAVQEITLVVGKEWMLKECRNDSVNSRGLDPGLA